MRISDKRLLNYSHRLRRLRYFAIVFLLFLLISLGTILYFGFQQLETNLLGEYQYHSKKLEQLIDKNLLKRTMVTNTLPVDVFTYYRQMYNPITNQYQQEISPISQLEYETPRDKWLVGYFQYCKDWHFNSPVWPRFFPEDELDGSHSNESSQQMSDQKLNLESLERKKRANKIYQLLLQSTSVQQKILKMGQQNFSNNNEFFYVFFDVPDYFIFYRVVSVAEQNWLQGYIVKRKPYLNQLVKDILEQLHFDSSVLVELKGEKGYGLSEYFFYESLPEGRVKVSILPQKDEHFQKQLIYKRNLAWPFTHYSLTVSTNYLPMTPAMVYSIIFIVILTVAILAACYGFYRLGVRQLALGEQRLNFVSSVSHELKTPLTSIQMYSQMLKEGTVISEAHLKDYYEFIHGESERLTRLINNILQLSSLRNQQQNVQPEYTPLTFLIDIIRSKTSSIIDKNIFQQNIVVKVENPENTLVLVDQDAFSQVIINITENAVKFFNKEKINDPKRQKIDFMFRQDSKNKYMIQLEIRDYGEGITTEQESKIFELFYRGGSELNRTTQGTGIGLALVNELLLAQHGEIRVERKDPGLAMIIKLVFTSKK